MQPHATAMRAVPQQPPPGRLEGFFIFIALMLVTQALEPLLLIGSSSSDDALAESNPASLLSALAIYCVALVLLARKPAQTFDTIKSNPLLVALFALPMLSIVWSVDPGTTFRRATALLMTGFFCIYIAQRLSPEEFLRRLLLALFVGGVLSILYTIADPQQAIEHSMINTGSWKGVYGHKAILGRIAAVAVAVSVYVRPRHSWEWPMRWATIGIFLFLSIKSQSRASWLMMMGAFAFMFLIAVLRNRRLSSGVKLTITLALGFTVLAVAALLFNVIITEMGRDDTFSGRTSLWTGAIAVAKETHPILGAGYRAFWTDAGAGGVREYVLDWARLPTHAHNGYLDVWLDMGIPGVVLFVCFVAMTIARLARRVLQEPGEPAWAAFSIFFFVFLLNNCSVTVAFKHTDIAWIFAVLAGLYTHGCVTARQPIAVRPKLSLRRLEPVFSAPPQPS
ncbi:MAG: O-antigen ligase family protein [Rhizomicrobium sp.]